MTLYKNVSFTIDNGYDFREEVVKTLIETPATKPEVYLIPESKPKKREPKPVPAAPEGLVLGENVRYYDNGWRVGRYDGMDKNAVLIMPIGKTKHIRVSERNVEPIEEITGSIGGSRHTI